jgi:ribonucleoside-diphosphate reductase alpha chain
VDAPTPALPRISERIWDAKYRLKGADGTPVDSTLADTWQRVADAVSAAESEAERERWAKAFAEAMADLAFLPAGRILAGAGAGRSVTLFNCFVMGRIGDDLSSIFENVREAALTMQQGGGIGHDFSTLRPRGAPVKSIGADASGPVSFMDVWDAMCRTIMSAGARRGAMMGTLRCDHPDIEAFVDAKADPARLRNFNVSVLVTDAFVRAVRDGAPWDLVFEGKAWRTVDARALWDRIMRATYDYAEPGVVFIDRVNAQNNLAYCETIAATNPCVPADTWVHTADGPRQVRDLVGRAFTARVHGRSYASAEQGFFATGHKPVLRVETAEGYALRLTADHPIRRFATLSRYRDDSGWCRAGDLAVGDLVAVNDHRATPNWGGRLTSEEGYLLGLLVGDGSLRDDKAIVSVWQPAVAVGCGTIFGTQGIMEEALRAALTLPHRSDFAGWVEVKGRNERRLALTSLKTLAEDLGMRPGSKAITALLEQTSSDCYRGFLRGLFDAEGSVQGSQTKGVSVRLAQSDLARLEAVQRMLLRLGIASTLYRNRRPAGTTRLPDGRGCRANYPTEPQHELVISGENLLQYSALVGFADYDKAHRLNIALSACKRALHRERFIARITAIVEDGTEDVFDVQIPGMNAFDANGFLAHNCGEQPLPPYGACLLGSINLARLVHNPFTAEARLDEARLEALTATAVRFLDDAIDVSNYPLEAQRQEAKAKRRIGLGVTGLADALILLGVRYGTPEAAALARRWMATIERAAYLASAGLAAEKGAFPLYDAERFLAAPGVRRLPEEVRAAIARHGIRNGLLTSIAPTGTISLLAGNVSSGIEPVFDFRYERRVLERDGSIRTEQVEDYAHALYRETFGPAAPLTEAFVTAEELSPGAHLRMQAAVQAHVDSSISKTVNCPADLSFDAFKDVYLEAYDLGLKGCTTYRPNAVTGAVLSRSAPVQAEESKPEGADEAAGVGGPAERQAGGAGIAADVAAPPPAPVERSVTEAAAPAPESAGRQLGDRQGDVVYIARPLERAPMLEGATYKLRWPGSDNALYITINDIERDGRRRPFEVFINTKNLEHYAWTVALTRMISAIFRRGGDVTFVVEELKAIFDPQGGQWMGGRYVPSLIAAIGEVIEAHMIRTGFLNDTEASVRAEGAARAALSSVEPSSEQASEQAPGAAGPQPAAGGRPCPRCGVRALHRREGCWVCDSCGYSKCG